MRKETRKETKMIAKPHKVEMDVVKYIADDGREFDTEEAAKTYEEYQKIPKSRFDVYFDLSGEWFYFNSEKEMKKNTWADNYEELGLVDYPAWILIQYQDTNNYDDDRTQYVYTVRQVKDIISEALNKLESL